MSGNGEFPRSGILDMDPTRKDAGLGIIGIKILYDPVSRDIQVVGSKGLDIVGILGIMRLAEESVVQKAMQK